jgi:hypothetical protein
MFALEYFCINDNTFLQSGNNACFNTLGDNWPFKFSQKNSTYYPANHITPRILPGLKLAVFLSSSPIRTHTIPLILVYGDISNKFQPIYSPLVVSLVILFNLNFDQTLDLLTLDRHILEQELSRRWREARPDQNDGMSGGEWIWASKWICRNHTANDAHSY